MAYRRKRRSSTAADVASIANRLSSTGAVILGVVCFVVFYWALPAWFLHVLSSMDGNQFKPIVAAIFEHRIHWLHRVGILLALICLLIAIYKLFSEVRLSRQGERNATFLSRVVLRLMN